MTLEEKLISCCKYYKGEEESPFKFGSKEGVFWDFERTTVISYVCSEIDIDFDTVDEEAVKKDIKDYVSALIGKWMPYDQDLILEY